MTEADHGAGGGVSEAPPYLPDVDAASLADVLALRDLPALFDRQRFGWNVLVGVAYFAALALTRLAWSALPILQGYGQGWSILTQVLAVLPHTLLVGAAFVIVVHVVRSVWALPVVWGLAAVGLNILYRAGYRALASTGGSSHPLFAPRDLLTSFLWGFSFMLALVLAVRLRGVDVWALMAGVVAHQLVWAATRLPRGVQWRYAMSAIFDGAILGGFLFAGIVVHLKVWRGLSSHRRGEPA